MKELQLHQINYRKKPNGECYICTNKVVKEPFYKDGFTDSDIERLWKDFGAMLCHAELDHIIPLGVPNEFHRDDVVILENLANRIKSVILKEHRDYIYYVNNRSSCDIWDFQFPFGKMSSTRTSY